MFRKFYLILTAMVVIVAVAIVSCQKFDNKDVKQEKAKMLDEKEFEGVTFKQVSYSDKVLYDKTQNLLANKDLMFAKEAPRDVNLLIVKLILAKHKYDPEGYIERKCSEPSLLICKAVWFPDLKALCAAHGVNNIEDLISDNSYIAIAEVKNDQIKFNFLIGDDKGLDLSNVKLGINFDEPENLSSRINDVEYKLDVGPASKGLTFDKTIGEKGGYELTFKKI